MKKILIILSILIPAFALSAQDAGKADALFLQGDYHAAHAQYAMLHRNYPATVLYTYRLGRCEQELGNHENAVQLLTLAGERYSMRPYWLAVSAYQTYRFQLAVDMYKAFIEANEPSEAHYEEAIKGLQKAELALRFFRRVENIAFMDSVSFPIDSLTHFLPQLSADMGILNYDNGQFVCTNERGDRRWIAFTDEKTGQRWIGSQQRLLDDWTPIDTLPKIVNQNDQQDFPFVMPDGVTLYYATLPQQGLGGWDIYVTKYNPANNTYLTPEPIGMPFNSIANDLLFLYDEMAQKGYFLTDRRTPQGKVTLYSFTRNEPRYLRDTTEDFLRAYVQLMQLPAPQNNANLPTTNTSLNSPILEELAVQQPDWKLIMANSIVYTSLDDFQVPEARLKMEEYIDLQAQINEEANDLANKRLAYKYAKSAEERKTLAPLIRSLENDVRRLRQEAKALRLEVIRLEHQ